MTDQTWLDKMFCLHRHLNDDQYNDSGNMRVCAFKGHFTFLVNNNYGKPALWKAVLKCPGDVRAMWIVDEKIAKHAEA